MIKLIISSKAGAVDIAALAANVTWSGDYNSAARTLSFSVIASATDKNIPTTDISIGNAVCFMADNATLFEGFVVSVQTATASNTKEITCFDGGFYTKNNAATYQFAEVTPEEAVGLICADFGIEVGTVAATGVKLTRNFIGVKLYDIIQTMYTLASAETDEKYIQKFVGTKLCIIKREIDAETLVLEGGANLMDSTATESIERLCNRVRIYAEDYSTVQTLEDAASIAAYGLIQQEIKTSDTAEKKAQQALNDGAPTHKITINALGDTRSVTGGMVVVREPYTGVYGLFYIDSDVHTWKRGQYYIKLVVNFKAIMDEKQAGTLPKSGATTAHASALTATGTAAYTTNRAWAYTYKGAD